MKKRSIRMKITLWFAGALILIVSLTYGVVLSVSRQVMQKTVRDGLIETVESNVGDIEYYDSLDEMKLADDVDHFMVWKNGYLEVDDDFLNQVNGIYTALYDSEKNLLYGENPIALESRELPLGNALIRKLSLQTGRYYIFDRKLDGEGLDGLWLRGVVSEEQTKLEMLAITRLSLILMPVLMVLALLGGYGIAGRMLRPVRKISETAEEIVSGNDLKKRIDVGEGQDELHQLATGFNSMFARLDQAFEMEKQFTSDVSHELRTPVAVIQAQCELMRGEEKPLEEYQHAMTVIERQSRKISKLIEDLLVYSRLERKTDKYPKEYISVSEIVSSVCEDMALIRTNGITLTSQVQENISCLGNRMLLTRLLVNLISNAYRYGRENGHIEVKLEQKASELRLSVADDGIGIAPEEQEKIFRRFYQVDASRTGEGTGLGLSMVQQIAEFHSGTIEVESVPGKGSLFTFSMQL